MGEKTSPMANAFKRIEQLEERVAKLEAGSSGGINWNDPMVRRKITAIARRGIEIQQGGVVGDSGGSSS